jgi:hypothetical protein
MWSRPRLGVTEREKRLVGMVALVAWVGWQLTHHGHGGWFFVW